MAKKSAVKKESLYDEACSAIDRVFGDTSVDRETTRGHLDSLICHIEIQLEALDADDDADSDDELDSDDDDDQDSDEY